VLQNELKGKSTSIVMVAFDLLYLNGYDLRKLPLFGTDRIRPLAKIKTAHSNEKPGARPGLIASIFQSM
jgi:ATP-dependent DNA ligase